ncbi:hypothetical protein [Actinoplanes sp. NPDC089786]|uniref:hypothetical protein n=1 Tax=Actinoplanes sp. NPDC089786 TaxID=3155185 RepID=UPI00343FAAF7
MPAPYRVNYHEALDANCLAAVTESLIDARQVIDAEAGVQGHREVEDQQEDRAAPDIRVGIAVTGSTAGPNCISAAQTR